MMQFNKSFLVKGCLPIAALAVMTACVDSKYDLDNIDTTSQFKVKDLTVPIKLQEIKLKDVLDLDDNDLIVPIADSEGKEIYAIQQSGDINSDFQINGIHVNAPVIPSTHKTFDIPDIPTSGGTTISAYPLPEIQLKDIPEQSYDFVLNDVDAALLELENVKTKKPINVEVVLQIDASIMNGNQVSFKDLVVKMPWGLMAESNENVKYNPTDGNLEVKELVVNEDGRALFSFDAYGLDMQGKGKVENNKLNISGKVGIESGTIAMTVTNVAIPKTLNLDIEYKVSSFDIASFSGLIDYKMDDINVAPISLNDLPDFLNNPETVIKIANPAINVNVNNPVGKYGLEGQHGQIVFSSDFGGGNSTPAESDEFTIGIDGAHLVFNNENFSRLGDILTNENVKGLPKEINVSIKNLQFEGQVVDFPIGDNAIDNARGDYKFTAPLGFEDGTKIIYEAYEDGWSGDDLDKINIEYLNVSAYCSTNLPVGVALKVFPVDRNGNDIPVNEESNNFIIEPYGSHNVNLKVAGKNGTIRDIDGIHFIATITQNSESGADETAIGPELSIKLQDISITVDGYYETDF